ncbi:hypothetical protein A9Q77_07940 [Marinomonas sp. 42_23_T18]|nr:hypothetical protein A9Q77_07940 [Marinomonas sp. 42_23_T18]
MSYMMVGAYGPFSSSLDEKAMTCFNEATAHFDDIQYTPVAVAIQVASGTNYAFFCDVKAKDSVTLSSAMITVFKPLEGLAGIMDIEILPS